MGIKKFKPNTPGQRFKQVVDFEEVTTNTPEKSLIVSIKDLVVVTTPVR